MLNTPAMTTMLTSRFARSGLVCLLIALGSAAANAGFIDERTSPAPIAVPTAQTSPVGQGAVPAAPRQAGTQEAERVAGKAEGVVIGAFLDAGWDSLAPAAGSPRSIPSAVSRLLPPKHDPVTIEGDEGAIDLLVTWPDAGITRKSALDHIAKTYGINIEMRGGTINVTKAPFVQGPVTYGPIPEDKNYRTMLKRWAAQSGWTFGDVHWQLPRDIPLVGGGTFGTDFQAAVRVVMDATLLTEMPGRPCFHSNNVMRILPRNELCDRIAK